VSDHCRGIWLAYSKGRENETYNIGGGKELSNLELTRKILAHLEISESQIAWVNDRLGHDRRYSVDYSKLADHTGYSPSVKFEEGLAQTIDWYRDNSQWIGKMMAKISNE